MFLNADVSFNLPSHELDGLSVSIDNEADTTTMTYNFFADRADKLEILKYIFEETDLQVFDLGSPFGQQICEYKTADEIASKFDLSAGDKFAVTFQLWSPRHKGNVLFRKIDLDPKRCDGHTFRYSTDGWGLIQLYFGGLKGNDLNQSYLGHFEQNEALKNEALRVCNGNVDAWDWPEIQATSKALKYQIHNKMATRRMGSFGVLSGADKLEKEGITFR